MRIISGKHKSKRINAPKNLPVRPTTDMAKEGLFNILNNDYYFDKVSVLDIFAGIGSISFEFASRGTTQITSVDKHIGCVSFLHKINKEFENNLEVIKSDSFSFLEKTNQKFDIIFADPPYNFEQHKFERIVNLVFENNLLKENGTLIVEHAKQTDLSNLDEFLKVRKYGSSAFSFF